MSSYRDQLESWLGKIEVGAKRVLDIGGSAYPVKGRVKSWNVKDYDILDNNNEKEWHEKWTEPTMEGDAEDFRFEYQYDQIFMLEVAEYLYRPEDAIGRISQALATDGVFYSSWPSIYPVHNPIESDNLRYTKTYIKWLLQSFSSIEITPRVATKGRDALKAFYALEGMRAVKNDDQIYDIGYMVKAIK